MPKILFAINHRDAEEMIKKNLGPNYLTVGAVSYREAIFNVLPGSGADILVVRDTIDGSLDTIEMLERIRLNFPNVRVVLISKTRKRGDPILSCAVGLGIYDIVINNNVPMSDILHKIQHPSSFADVKDFYISVAGKEPQVQPTNKKEEPSPAADEKKKKGFLGNLFRSDEKHEEPLKAIPQQASPINVELLRETMRKEARIEAQKELEPRIREAVLRATDTSAKEYERLRASFLDCQHSLSDKDLEVQSLSDALNKMTQERSAAVREAASLRSQLDASISRDVKSEIDAAVAAAVNLAKEEAHTSYSVLLSQFEDKQKEYEKKCHEVSSLSQKITTLVTEKHAVEERCKTLQSECDSLRAGSDPDASSSPVGTNQRSPEWFEAQQKSWSLREQELLRKLATKEKETSSIQSRTALQINDLKKQIEDRDKQITLLTEENKDLVLQVSVPDQVVRKAQEAMDEAKRISDDAQRRIQDADTRCAEANRRVEELLKRIDTLQKSIAASAVSAPATENRKMFDVTSNISKVIMMMGTAHGVGNTTAAINLAAMLASKQKNVLLIEFNDLYAVGNTFFRLTKIPLGIGAALRAAQAGDRKNIDPTIIRFNDLRSFSRKQTDLYRTLPPGFHFIPYSNRDIMDCQGGSVKMFRPDAIVSLIQILIARQEYDYIILDIQPDDQEAIYALMRSGAISKAIFSMNSDNHSIGMAMTLLSNLGSFGSAVLIDQAEYLLLRHVPRSQNSPAHVADLFHKDHSQFDVVEEASSLYDWSNREGLPLVLKDPNVRGEFEKIAAKVF